MAENALPPTKRDRMEEPAPTSSTVAKMDGNVSSRQGKDAVCYIEVTSKKWIVCSCPGAHVLVRSFSNLAG